MSADFSVEITDGRSPDVKIAHLQGELDEVSIEALKEEIDKHLANGTVARLIFDCTNLDFINSKGIGYLVSVHTHLAKDGHMMIIAAANEPVMDVISLVGLTTIIPYFATVEEALTQL